MQCNQVQSLLISEKIGCAYCGYVNGLVHYWVVIFAEMEKYWCGIKHKKNRFYQKDYLEYDDEASYREYPLTYSQIFFQRMFNRKQ